MADTNGDSRPTGATRFNVLAWSGLGSFIVGIGALISAFLINVAESATIAIKVAEQHGQELVEIRASIDRLREEMLLRTGDRYSKIDAANQFQNHESVHSAIEDRMFLHERELSLLHKQVDIQNNK